MPPSSTNRTLWCDASDTTRLWKEHAMSNHPAEGEAVRAWDDSSDATDYGFLSEDNNTSHVPVYNASSFNGNGALTFDGTDDRLIFSTDDWGSWPAVSTILSATGFTIFISLIMEGDGGSDVNPESNDKVIGDSTGYLGLFASTIGGQSKLTGFIYDSVGPKRTTIDINQDTNYVVCVSYNGSTLSINANNGSITNSISSGNPADLSGLFVISKGTFFQGKIGEVIIYNAGLTGTDLSDTWSYMESKWLISSEPNRSIAEHVSHGSF